MKITPGAVLTNLKNWNWDVFEKYSLRKEESDAIVDLLERDKPKMAIVHESGTYAVNHCPNCDDVIAIESNYCSHCGQRISQAARLNKDFDDLRNGGGNE